MADLSSQFYTEFIKQLGLGINISRTYPKGHPSLNPIVQRLKILLKEVPLEKEFISLVVIEDVIMIEEDRFDSKRLPMVKSLVDRFNQLQVKSISFNVDAGDDEIKEFFGAMAATALEVADAGDIVALVRTKGITQIKINKFRVGVVSSDQEIQEVSWEKFLESLVISDTDISEEKQMKELGSFLAGVGVLGNEPVDLQTTKIVGGLEKLATIIADQYGEGRWDEYSLVFSRILSFLSPTIKKNIVQHKTENKKMATLFRTLIPTMADEDIVAIIAAKAKEKSASAEEEIVNILKNITGTKLPDILSTLRVNVPELNFEKIVNRLMGELKTTKGTKEADKFVAKNLETEMRMVFPHLRDSSHEERIKAIDDLMAFIPRIFESNNYDLLRLLIDRFDTMADAETDIKTFSKVIEALKNIYLKSGQVKLDELIQFISKKFSKHLMRKEAALLERKKIVIKAISELKDQNYVPELVSLLWDAGSFVEAREALIALADFSIPLLIETLKDTDDHSIRMKIIDVLKKIGEKAVPEVVKLLSSPEWYIRRNSISILGEIGTNSSIDDIGRMVDDENEQVQYEAVEALQKFDDEKARSYLKKALDSKYPKVVLSTMRVLNREDVKPKLIKVTEWLKARRGTPDEKEEKFRQEILSVLGEKGDDTVVNALAEVLNERSLFKGELLLSTKEAALYALFKIGGDKAMGFLQSATKNRDSFVAATAQEIIKKGLTPEPKK